MCTLFKSDSPDDIHRLASKAGVEYIFLEDTDQSFVYTHLTEPYFSQLIEEGQMAIYRVNTGVHRDAPAGEMADIAVGKDNAVVLLRRDHVPILQARLGGNFYGPEPHGICETAQWMSNDGQLVLMSEAPMQGELSFSALSLGKPRTLVIYADNTEVYRGRIAARGGHVNFPVTLQQGRTRFRINCPEGAEVASAYGGTDRRSLSFKIYRLQFTPK